MKQKINKTLKEQADRLKKAVDRLLNIPPKKSPAFAVATDPESAPVSPVINFSYT
jgi:hypothetical protein